MGSADICDEDTGECHWETRSDCDQCYFRGDPCIASCEGRECGSDGCTSNCGACSEGLACKEGMECKCGILSFDRLRTTFLQQASVLKRAVTAHVVRRFHCCRHRSIRRSCRPTNRLTLSCTARRATATRLRQRAIEVAFCRRIDLFFFFFINKSCILARQSTASEAGETVYSFDVPKGEKWGMMTKVSGHRIEDGEEVNCKLQHQ